MSSFSWTQPTCLACYEREFPGRRPSRLREPESETCVYCGGRTLSGIYVRISPDEAPHPTRMRE